MRLYRSAMVYHEAYILLRKLCPKPAKGLLALWKLIFICN